MSAESYADAWLSECWAPVRQYHDGDSPTPKPDRARRMPCDACGEMLPRDAVALHIRERHGAF